MDADFTIVATVNPKGRTVSLANGAVAGGELVEGELMGLVNDVANCGWETAAKCVDVEAPADIAAVEIAVD